MKLTYARYFFKFLLFSSVYITYGEQNKLLKKFFCFCFSERICSLQKVKNLRDNKLKQKENVGRMRTYDPRSLIKGGLISKSIFNLFPSFVPKPSTLGWIVFIFLRMGPNQKSFLRLPHLYLKAVCTKGKFFSKGLFGVIVWTKNQKWYWELFKNPTKKN